MTFLRPKHNDLTQHITIQNDDFGDTVSKGEFAFSFSLITGVCPIFDSVFGG